MNIDWQGKQVLVTGGASFIGSHLVDALLARGAVVRVADDLSSGRTDNLVQVKDQVHLIRGDLKDVDLARTACSGQEVVFHLAADHGGRGYVDLHQVACASNLWLDQVVFQAAADEGAEKVVFASSGCAYPNHLQGNVEEELFLTEDMAGPPYDPDGMYGLAKVAGELTLKALHKERGLKSASCRFFTVYGPRGIENHAVMAMIARAFIKEDPFVVWGTGEQIRNWTYVDDIVSGLLAAAERIDDGTAVNLGTMERIRVMDAVEMVMRFTGHQASIKTRPDMPTGPMNRVADNSLAKRLMGWEPQVAFEEGLRRTIDWYFSTKDPEQVARSLYGILTERPTSAVSQPR